MYPLFGFIKKNRRPLFLFYFLALSSVPTLYSQNKTSIGLDLTEDFSNVISGGLDRGTTLMGLIALTHETNLWKGAVVKGHHVLNHGKALTHFLGDLQTVSNIEAPKNIYLYEFFIEQAFKGNKIILGKSEINSLFAYSSNAMGFIHSSFGIGPEMSVNVPLATYPYAAMGVSLDLQFSEKIQFRGALYDGSPNTSLGYLNSFDFGLNSKGGLFWIGEFQHKTNNKANTFKLGLWKLESNTQNEGGFYAVIDQVLWKENNDSNRGINAFAQYGHIPKDPSIFNQYKGFGFVYYGALKNRSQDEIGLAWGRGSLSNNYLRQLSGSSNSSESVLETYYNYVLSDQIEIQLDAQYIVNPGVDEGIKNAWVGIVRVKYRLF